MPSGFFAPQKSSNNNYHPSHGASSQRQQPPSRAQPQFGYVHNYGRPPPPSYFPYNNGPSQRMHAYPMSASTLPTAITTTAANASRKRPREESSCAFRCEPCGLDLDSALALESHQKSHVKCNACDFQGAPKVVKGHYQSVHGKFSGQGFKTVTVAIPGCPVQRFRICVGNRPEDVQKWIAERKKKFPRSARPAVPPQTKSEQLAKTEGLASLLAGYSSSEDEKEEQLEGDKKETLDTTCDTSKTESSSPKQNVPPPSLPRKKPCHSFVRHGKCRRGDACPYSHDESLRRNPKSNGRNQNSKKKDLLSNLLESDVDREAKLSLQLIHYLVHSEFLKKRI